MIKYFDEKFYIKSVEKETSGGEILYYIVKKAVKWV